MKSIIEKHPLTPGIIITRIYKLHFLKKISMRYLLFLSFVFSLISCRKESMIHTEKTNTSIEISYKITVSVNWQSPQFSVPTNAHVTPLIGMIHSRNTFLWNTSGFATKGLENVAEDGDNTVMNKELDSILATKKSLSKFTIPRPLVTGSVDTTLKFNLYNSYISFASMIAPSPDWFMGIHDVNLLIKGKWADSLTLDINVYDAGTEEGDVFAYNNLATMPQDIIHILTPLNATVLANGNSSIAPFATIKFIKK